MLRRLFDVSGESERQRLAETDRLPLGVLAVLSESPLQRAALLADGLIADGAGHERQAAAAVEAVVRLCLSVAAGEVQRARRGLQTEEVRELLVARPVAQRVWSAARRAVARELSDPQAFRASAHELMDTIAAADAADAAIVASFVAAAPKTSRILRSYGDTRNAQLLGNLQLRESIVGHLNEFMRGA